MSVKGFFAEDSLFTHPDGEHENSFIVLLPQWFFLCYTLTNCLP